MRSWLNSFSVANNKKDETESKTVEEGNEAGDTHSALPSPAGPTPPPRTLSKLSSSFGFGARVTSTSGATNSAASNIPTTPQRPSSWSSPPPPLPEPSPYKPHQDVRLEKQVSQAATALGDGVQKIVLQAKQKTVEENQWKADLLQLLGNEPTQSGSKKSDMDVLLASSKCEKFVLRCVEAELPPNLIHCLRLLRVLELQHAAKAAQETNGDNEEEESEANDNTNDNRGSSNNNNKVENLEPIARRATNKVARLLGLLCKDVAVGEQLRPHLFGLLALSGASYPRSGIHVAHAASDVIAAVADGCLTRQLIWFIHERKMILHMTDDIKELTGMVAQSVHSQVATTTAAAHGLLGADAEEAGLWWVALKTVVHLVTASVRLPTVELVKDFDAAGGYAVLQYAIHNSTKAHGNQLISLLPTLACTPTETGWAEEDVKLALNGRALILLEDLAKRSNPLVRAYFRKNPNSSALPDPSDAAVMRELAQLSLETALAGDEETADWVTPLPFDVSLAVLEATLQIFADHPENYTLLESRQHILTFSLLAFPCYKDEDIKSLGLKILEFVLTGVMGVIEQVSPVHATVEIFFCLAQYLLTHESAALRADAVCLGETLEKLLQFDQRVAPLMVESGILTTNLNGLLSNIVEQSTEGNVPPLTTPSDDSFILVYRVLTLLVAHQPSNFSDKPEHASFAKQDEVTNLHSLLRVSVDHLGNEACHAATSVFEAYMTAYQGRDIEFVLKLLRRLSAVANASLIRSVLIRQAMLLNMIRSVLEARSLARDTFRQCRGYEECLRLFVSLEGAIQSPIEDTDVSVALLKLFESVICLWDASIGVKSRNPLSAGDVAPLQLPPALVIDSLSSQLSTQSPAALNRNYIRQRALYLNLSTSWAATGLGNDSNVSTKVIEMAFSHIDPALAQHWNEQQKEYMDRTEGKEDEKGKDTKKREQSNSTVSSIRNPDAVRLVIGLSLHLAHAGQVDFAKASMSCILELTMPSQVALTLPQVSSCALCYSLTNEKEFGPLLLHKENPLSSQMLTLLGRVAAYGTSYMDFVNVLRCIAGPILETETSDGKRVRLPVISSAIGREKLDYLSHKDDDARKRSETESIERLSIINDLARRPERYPRLILGGDSINTIGTLMHQVKLDDRLRAASEEGRLKFIEIESVDASALEIQSTGATPSTTASQTTPEQIWAPLANAGFSYSIWMRHHTSQSDGSSGNLYVVDICSPALADATSKHSSAFFSVWFDIQNQRFNVMSSASHRGEPISFPVSPLVPGVWHHVLITYAPGKRTMMSRKSAFAIYVDGRPLETDIKVDTVNLPPNSKLIIGAPNPALAASGIVRGKLPIWEVGPVLMLSTVLLELDATALFAYGPDFPGLLWGDRPQRLSLTAMATSLFSSLAETGEIGSVASALRRRSIPKLEGAGSAALLHSGNNSLEALNLFCHIPLECVLVGLQPGTSRWKLRNDSTRDTRRLVSERIANLARLNSANTSTSTDAIVYGRGCVTSPMCFSDSLQWLGGPSVLMPVLAMTTSTKSLAIALKILRESCRRHPPNLESMQAGGGYRMLALLLQEKPAVDQECLDQCVALGIHGFEPEPTAAKPIFEGPGSLARRMTFGHWVIADLEAVKHVLLNHQVWDLKKYGPSLTLRLMNVFNRLVDHKCAHKAFNARRLHMAGIVRWTLHVMIEAADLYSINTDAQVRKLTSESDSTHGDSGNKVRWSCDAPLVADVSVGGDPGNPFLQTCKNLLRRVLTFMLTPSDLEAISEALIYTVSTAAGGGGTGAGKKQLSRTQGDGDSDARMAPTTVTRLYLVRLLEELIVDGVNEIIASAGSSPEAKGSGAPITEITVQPHTGGVASPAQPYLSHVLLSSKDKESPVHPKHNQAQNFLSAFAGFLTPIWFATMLEGCREEATGAAVVRLLVLMLQSSSSFEIAFQGAGEFGPFIMSVPRFSTCASILISVLSNLLFVPILHVHSLPTLDPDQICEIFDAETSDLDAVYLAKSSDPSNGIFALVAECIGRNVQLAQAGADFSPKAEETNRGVLRLLIHRHEVSQGFRDFCSSTLFLEPFVQTVCLVNQQKPSVRSRRYSLLADCPKGLTPTERFIGGSFEGDGSMVELIRFLQAVISGVMVHPFAARALSTIFRSFPVHASAFQVKALHLLVVEYVGRLVREKCESGTIVELTNCVGACSVLLDQLVCGYATTEQIFEGSKIVVEVLNALVSSSSPAVSSLKGSDHTLLVHEGAHVARLYIATALRWAIQRQDEGLQAAILEVVEPLIESILLVPSRDRKIPTSGMPKVPLGSKMYPMWQSLSVSRCSPTVAASYPQLEEDAVDENSAFAPLMFSLYHLLLGASEDIRKLAISIIVALLQHKSTAMNELLVAEVEEAGQVETIDVVSRGGFRALLAAHEAAEMNRSTQQTVKRKYASFFEWLEKNHDRVETLFNTVDERALQTFPGLQQSVVPQDVTVEEHQKVALVRYTNLASADRTIINGMQRADLSRRCTDKMIDSHAQWKKHGFDDLAYGALKWKTVLRQLKGTYSVWEGYVPTKTKACGFVAKMEEQVIALKAKLTDTEKKIPPVVSTQRWKLDLSEGPERQRRRLLPNYEFEGLYNLGEEEVDQNGTPQTDGMYMPSPQMEATAELLKDLNLRRVAKNEDTDEFEDVDGEDGQTDATSATGSTGTVAEGALNTEGSFDGEENPDKEKPMDHNAEMTLEELEEFEESSSYELINGLLQAGDYPESSFNVRRCTGLEVTKALFLWCRDAVYVLDGFEQTMTEGAEPKITRVEREKSNYHVALRPKDIKSYGGDAVPTTSGAIRRQVSRARSNVTESTNEIIYQHRSKRISFSEVHSVFRRRYQLQQNALEIFDVNNNATLIAFDGPEQREEVLTKILSSKLPNSIMSSSYTAYLSYAKFISNFKAKIISQWVAGKMTNFDFLMHLNSLAGRSFNDLTQYPVFPWVIADYESEELDLTNPKTFRDLSKPMGALGENRAEQFRERYESLAASYESEDDPPPFHYGTHYSCAAYVLYYQMRLEPFSRLALALQGGKFDVADRLFHDVGRSWKSSSEENLQDVRELIPEFFFLPEFLVNTNDFDFGETQKGKTVHDVTLPPWAKGDPRLFVQLNRKALESSYVSQNLHKWIDLVFGHKQRGEKAVEALNTFVHVTYEGEVDIDSMDDPIQKASTIAQIQNFGQTPKQLDRKPFPSRTIVSAIKDRVLDFGTFPVLAPLTPPFCMVGAPHRVLVKMYMTDTLKLGNTRDKAVGDMVYSKGQLIGVGRLCTLIDEHKKYWSFGGANNGVIVRTAALTSRFREADKVLSVHDCLHRAPITAAKACPLGKWLVTGCLDSTIRIWNYDGTSLTLKANLCGHDGSAVSCIDLSIECGLIVSGCAGGRVLLWDLRSLIFVRELHHDLCDGGVTSVSINKRNGNVLTLVSNQLNIFDINGNIMGKTVIDDPNQPTCATSTNCPEWQEGVVAVTGHRSGEVRFWGLDYEKRELTVLHILQENTHANNPISALKVTGIERQDTLLVGDQSGKMSVNKAVQMDTLSPEDLNRIIEELS